MGQKEAGIDEVRAKKWLARLRHLDPPQGSIGAYLQSQFLEDEEFLAFLREDVGISVAGFLYLDAGTRDVRFQFFSDARGGNKSEAFMLPYQWHNQQLLEPNPERLDASDAAAFIDTLFYIYRELQSPWYGEQEPRPVSALKQAILPAEYLVGLYQPEAGETGPLRDRGWHYCSHGSTVFSLYKWRILLGEVAGHELHKWYVREGTGLLDGDAVEAAFCFALREKQVPKFESALRGLTACEGSGSGSLESEWRKLLLLAPNGDGLQPGPSLAALCHHILNLHHRDSSVDRLLTALAGGKVTELTMADIIKVESLVRRIVFSKKQSLLEFHRSTPFPIIPYYYWSLLDSTPKTHLVVPSWHSYSRPTKLLIGQGKLKLTYLASVCLAGISPLPGPYDSTVNEQANTIPTIGDRVEVLSTVINRLSLPQIDSIYYRTIGQREATVDAYISLAHDLGKDINLNLAIIGRKGGFTDAEKLTILSFLSTRLRFKPELRKLWLTYSDKNKASTDLSTQVRAPGEFKWFADIIYESWIFSLITFALSDSLLPLREKLWSRGQDAPKLQIRSQRAARKAAEEAFSRELLILGQEQFHGARQVKWGHWPITLEFSGPNFKVPAPEINFTSPVLLRLLQFIFDEVFANTFKHQLNNCAHSPMGEFRFKISTSAILDSISFEIRCSPVCKDLPSDLGYNATDGGRHGLLSLGRALEIIGCTSEYARPRFDRAVPFCSDVRADGIAWRLWSFKGLPMKWIIGVD